MPPSRDEGGTVTAEAALILPLIAAFCLALIWMLSVAIGQVRVVDAARDAARAVARGDDRATAATTARRTAPGASQVQFAESGGAVTATVSARIAAPGWLLVPLPSAHVESSATVEVESDVGGQP
jgi:Flp pilus assembly protein TadG